MSVVDPAPNSPLLWHCRVFVGDNALGSSTGVLLYPAQARGQAQLAQELAFDLSVFLERIPQAGWFLRAFSGRGCEVLPSPQGPTHPLPCPPRV